MGGTTSKPTLPAAPQLDITRGTFSGDYLKQVQEQGEAAALAAQQLAQEAQAQASRVRTIAGGIGGLAVFGLIIVGLLYLIDYVSYLVNNTTIIGIWKPPTTEAPSDALYIDNAMYGTDGGVSKNVTDFLNSKLSSDQRSLPSFKVNFANVGLSEDPNPGTPNKLTITWQIGNCSVKTNSAQDNEEFPTLNKEIYGTGPDGKLICDPSSGLLSSKQGTLAGTHDATTTTSLAGSSAPLSSEDKGAYGIQWWMFIKDWNYGYGQEKKVLVRSDPSNASIMNPSVSLHPTDNTLKVSVSIFPSSSGGMKLEPAPATGSTSATDDVFICEVTSLPLQSWFSVSLTVFERNVDVYIDGKLVKSCVLPGVPKPVVGDIKISPDGGFSGYVCDVVTYPKMLTPTDAITFYTNGTTCKSKTDTTSIAKDTTGYSVKFGVYDTVGKKVQEYTF